jgi:hypothetical protein
MVCAKTDWGDWHQGNGSRTFFEDLQWAVEHCGGIVRVVVAVRDTKALPQVRMAECYPCRVEAAYEFTGGNVEDLPLDNLRSLMTVTQFVTDLCLNEIEDRGALTYPRDTGQVIVPYQCDHMIETVLTRGEPHEPGRLTTSESSHLQRVSFARFEGVLNAARETLEDEKPEATPAEIELQFLALAGF